VVVVVVILLVIIQVWLIEHFIYSLID